MKTDKKKWIIKNKRVDEKKKQDGENERGSKVERWLEIKRRRRRKRNCRTWLQKNKELIHSETDERTALPLSVNVTVKVNCHWFDHGDVLCSLSRTESRRCCRYDRRGPTVGGTPPSGTRRWPPRRRRRRREREKAVDAAAKRRAGLDSWRWWR